MISSRPVVPVIPRDFDWIALNKAKRAKRKGLPYDESLEIYFGMQYKEPPTTRKRADFRRREDPEE
jgi:hypothetical protein